MTSLPVADAPGPGGERSPAGQVVRLAQVEAFDSFYAREYVSLVALAHALTGSTVHAEDIAQEAMLAAYRRWEDIAQLDLPFAWVRRVCANIATSFVRRRMVEARAALKFRAPESGVAELSDDNSAFWAEVRRLPRRQAQCVALRYVYGCSVAEVSQVLGCAEGTVKSHLSRGRATLARRLGERVDEETES